MPVILGIDTGGTYTDSVLVDADSRQVLHKAKAFTTRQDLLCGIAESLDNLQFDRPADISIVCLSTTLATNAVVEHQGGRVGVFLLGRDAEGALPAAYVHRLRGTLNIKGRILEDIVPDEAAEVARSWAGHIDAVAISGFAGVRNPVHEQRIRDIVQQELDVPVVCAHELSSSLGFHERTVTAILNASLIPNIRELIDATDRALLQRGIHAPIMIVKGDGSLMRADFARNRPIETVLSGPAASIVGGLFLSGVQDAVLLDMGGTTSDLARVQNGQVTIRASGASVGGWRTQLRAAEISTFGIGGDSRLHWSPEGQLTVGPQRVLPLCVAGQRNPDLVRELLTCPVPPEYELFEEQACECYAFLQLPRHREATESERRLFNLLSDGPHPLFYLAQHLETDVKELDLTALVREGVLQRCGLTPTDLLHARGRMTRWNMQASLAGAQALAARRGLPLETFLDMAFTAVETRLRESCLQAAAEFTHCTFSPGDPTARFFLDGGNELLRVEVGLDRPIIALGAPVAAWLPEVCRRLHTKLIIPPHAEVANAVGAAVGQIVITAEALIRPDQHHKGYLVHAAWGNRWFLQLSEAQDWAEQTAATYAKKNAANAGSTDCSVSCRTTPTYVQPHAGGEKTFIETRITVTAIGSPHWKE